MSQGNGQDGGSPVEPECKPIPVLPETNKTSDGVDLNCEQCETKEDNSYSKESYDIHVLHEDVKENSETETCSLPNNTHKSSTLPSHLSPHPTHRSRSVARHSIPHDQRLTNPLRSSRSHDQKLTSLSASYKPHNKRLSNLIGSSKSHDNKSASDRDIAFSANKSAPPNFEESLLVQSFKERFKQRQKLEFLRRSGSQDPSQASESSFEDFKSFTDSNSVVDIFSQSFESCAFYSCSEIPPVDSDCDSYTGYVSASNSLSPIAARHPTARLYQHLSKTRNVCDENAGRGSLKTVGVEPNSIQSSVSQFDSFHTALSDTLPKNLTLRTDSNFDSFVTLPDYEANPEKFSKLTKAKDALIKGCDFVKAKFNLYKTRIPSLLKGDKREDNSGDTPSWRCNNSCGFSCIHLGKEISQYSIGAAEGQDIAKEGHPEGHLKGDYSNITQEDSSSSFPSVPPKICFEQYLIKDKYRLRSEASDSSTEVPVMSGKTDGEPNLSDKASPGQELSSGKVKGDNQSCLLDQKDSQCDETCDSAKMTVIDQSTTGKGGPQQQAPPTHHHHDIGYNNNDDSAVVMESDSFCHDNSMDKFEEDDLPIGTEAHTMGKQCQDSPSPGRGPSLKRVQWLSASRERTQGSSVHSSATSNSRHIDIDDGSDYGDKPYPRRVDQILQEREMDPETLLKNLGFGCSPGSDESYSRIPDRFLTSDKTSGGIDLYQFILEHPELHHFLPIWAKPMPVTRVDAAVPITSPARKPASKGGWSRAQSFTSVLHGMKLLQSVQAGKRAADVQFQPPCEEDDQNLLKLNSVLDFKNRKALAEQGFYGSKFMKTPSKSSEGKSDCQKELSAADRRKQFHQSGKSRNWSLTEESEEPRDNVNSFDSGLLRSFSLGRSSDSSIESLDNEEIRQNSISDLRRQFELTIRQSMDEDMRFPGSGDDTNISGRRKEQVNRLMSSIDDDGDYFAQSRQSSIKEKTTLNRSQGSTLTSPQAPKSFDFESPTKAGENFYFSCKDPTSPKTSSHKSSAESRNQISIIVEDQSEEAEEPARRVRSSGTQSQGQDDYKGNPNELVPTNMLTVRSDSCHTLVGNDGSLDQELGELTPRPGDISPSSTDSKFIIGDALSESTGSSGTIHTLVTNIDEVDHNDNQRSRSPVLEIKIDDNRLHVGKETLPPQESFELEEVSSGENATEEIQDGFKSSSSRGKMEKSNSTHSDSSGFADSDQSGEGTQSTLNNNQIPFVYNGAKMVELEQNAFNTYPMATRQNHHSNKIIHSTSLERPYSWSLQQQNHIERQKPPEKIPTITDSCFGVRSSRSLDEIHVCQKQASVKPRSDQPPVVTSISYGKSPASSVNKSVRYTVEIPGDQIFFKQSCANKYSKNDGKLVKGDKKFVSMVHIDVLPSPHPPTSDLRGPCTDGCQFKVRGDTQYRNLHQSEPNLLILEQPPFVRRPKPKDSLNFSQNGMSISGTLSESSSNMTPDQNQNTSNRDKNNSKVYISNGNYGSLKTKHEILRKKKSKEALVAAKSQTADWLLNNQRLERVVSPPLSSQSPVLPQGYMSIEPRSTSTPALHKSDEARLGLSQPSASLYLRDQPLGTPQRRANNIQSSLFSLTDESINLRRSSLDSGSLSLPEDRYDYLKLARLINAPSPSLSSRSPTTMSVIRYRPVTHMKHWHQLNKQQHLEEEVRLMQHALQKYKVELTMMETMLFNSFQLARSQLTDEERADVEELQCLWAEIRKEVTEMEAHLSTRLTCVNAGNDNFNPLSSLDIVQTMIDLLREQLYQQQMNLSKDINDDDGDDLLYLVSPAVSASTMSLTSGPWWSEKSQPAEDIRNTVDEMRNTVTQSQLLTRREMQKSFSELRENLVEEVKHELVDNTKWLQLQLQAKDNEIQRLKMENFMQNISGGGTRRRQTIETDV